MNKDQLAQLIMYKKAEEWLKMNPERLTSEEKTKFKVELMEYLIGASKTVSDEVYDFLVFQKLITNDDRHSEFAGYLRKKYPNLGCQTILDVGAGRMCHLSEKLAKTGANIVAMDPNIRITQAEAKAKKIMAIKKELFMCDEYAKNNLGTDISKKDLIVGLEPCMATEHIIRQGLKKGKPFEVSLCFQNHPSLSGQQFKSYEDWFKFLKSISTYIDIVEYKNSMIATNNNIRLEKEKLLLPDEPER